MDLSSTAKNPIRLPLTLRVVQKLEFPHKLGICERVFAKQLAVHGTCWVKTAAGPVWKLDLSNSTLRWIVYGKYEGAGFFSWAERALPSNGIVVDSGSNIGQMLLYLAAYVPTGRILAFEPGAHQADWLQECLGVHPQFPVELLRIALGAEHRRAFLQTCGPEHTHGSWNRVAESGECEIEVMPLASVLKKRGFDHVDLWKLDVEGHEVQALAGAVELLQSKSIRALWIEMVGANGTRIRDFLMPLGYRAFLLNRRGTPIAAESLPAHCNALFLPQ